MPKFWEKLQNYINNALKKQKQEKVSFPLCGGGVSTTKCEILPRKRGGNTGDIAISSPCMLGFFLLLDFTCISNITKLCTKFGGRRSRITPAIVRFMILCLNWSRLFFG